MADSRTIENQMACCWTTIGVVGGRTPVRARQLCYHQDLVRCAGDDTAREGGQRIQYEAIRWQITDKRGVLYS